MNISICITVLNEEKTIGALLDSLLNQSKKPDEIVIVDGKSKDKTVEIINHYQKRFGKIRLLKENCSRAKGRNLSVEIAKGDVILMTDAGCIASRNWLKNITEPFELNEKEKSRCCEANQPPKLIVDIVAGFYKMGVKNNFQKAESVFLGTQPKDFDITFLPSTRSIAFTKQIWEKVGGFPENLTGAAEDTVFNYKLIKAGAKFARVKNAIVEWGMPETVGQFKSKIADYAKGDAKSKIWFFPGKDLASHNIKALSILSRYFLAFIFLAFSIYYRLSPIYWFIGLLGYWSWAFRKVYLVFSDRRVALWGPILQIVSDVGVMSGFLQGIFNL